MAKLNESEKYSVILEKNTEDRSQREKEKLLKKKIKYFQTIMGEADVVCSTFEFLSHPAMKDSHFPVVIINEAGNVMVGSSLLALQFKCEKLLMFDSGTSRIHHTNSDQTQKAGLDKTLLQRLISVNGPPIKLEKMKLPC